MASEAEKLRDEFSEKWPGQYVRVEERAIRDKHGRTATDWVAHIGLESCVTVPYRALSITELRNKVYTDSEVLGENVHE